MRQSRRNPNDRIPLGVPRAKLSVPPRPGYVRRWINDKENRLWHAQQAGWQFVEDPKLKVGEAAESGNRDMGSRVSRPVGTHKTGAPMYCYLMEIKQELYEEDQAEKQRKLDEIDQSIKGGNISGNTGGDEYYVKQADFRSS